MTHQSDPLQHMEVANTPELLTIFVDINNIEPRVADELWALTEVLETWRAPADSSRKTPKTALLSDSEGAEVSFVDRMEGPAECCDGPWHLHPKCTGARVKIIGAGADSHQWHSVGPARRTQNEFSGGRRSGPEKGPMSIDSCQKSYSQCVRALWSLLHQRRGGEVKEAGR